MRTTIICDPASMKISSGQQQQQNHSQSQSIQMENNRYLKRKRSQLYEVNGDEQLLDISGCLYAPPASKTMKRMIQVSHCDNYNNYQISHHENQQPEYITTSSSLLSADGCTTSASSSSNCCLNQNQNQNQNQTVEYVNVLYDNNLLPLQANSIISEANTVNLSELTATWNTNDLLDLDQKQNQNNFLSSVNAIDSIGKNDNSQSTEDLEDKNLSWLFNFKLDELPHLSPEVNRQTNRSTQQTGKKIDEIIQEATSYVEEDEIVVAENIVIENTSKVLKKPPFTYTELIEYALEDRGELTVSGIYQWISDRFPYYKSNDDRWKNSVRHNLSINPHFRKGSKAPQGAGHLWTISSRESEANNLAWEHKKQRLELFFKMEAAHSPVQKEIESPSSTVLYDETLAATASIIPQNDEPQSPESRLHIEALQSPFYANHQSITFDNESVDDLRRAAGEILNGVRRNVEVQNIQPNSISSNYHGCAILDSGDYLNPVSKDEIVQESGLRCLGKNEIGNDYFVTEIDPIELGINMTTNGEEEVLFGDDFNLNYFGIGPGNMVA